MQVLRALEDAGFDARVLQWGQPAAMAGVHDQQAAPTAATSAPQTLPVAQKQAAPQQHQEQVVQLVVRGMTCAACSTAVEKALGGVPGVSRASVALTQGRAEVRFDVSRTNTVRWLCCLFLPCLLPVSFTSAEWIRSS
jgi:copper chaperone CopZ